MPTYVSTKHSYSSAVQAGDFIFLGLHRGAGDDFAAQLRDTMNRLEKTLVKLGRPLGSIVKVSVYLKKISDLREMEHLFRDYFEPEHYPARMTTTTEFWDKDCLVMIDGVAIAKDTL